MQYPPNPSQAFRIETLAPPLIVLLSLASLQPLAVIMAKAFPYQIGDPQWRVGLFAYLLAVVPQFSICLVLIAGIGLFSERYWAVRTASGIAIAIAILLVPMLVFDALDVMQVRQMVGMDRLRAYDFNALQSWGIAILMIPVLFWVGRKGLQAGRRLPTMDITDALMIDKEPAPGPLDPRVTN